jgi:diacylglycerol O-acyltransferase / wax synthase
MTRPAPSPILRAVTERLTSLDYNLTVSNIPGPRFPVYMLGAELIEAHPVVPIAQEHALSIGVFSDRDHLFWGLYADPDAFPEVSELPPALGSSLRALARRPKSPQFAAVAAGHGLWGSPLPQRYG